VVSNFPCNYINPYFGLFGGSPFIVSYHLVHRSFILSLGWDMGTDF
jgi:hypothetical protein